MTSTRRTLPWLVLALALALLGSALWAGRREHAYVERVEAQTGGNVRHGHHAIVRYGCGACHEIPGIAGANGQAGPPLKGVGNRQYIAGRLRNSPDNMVLWISHPRQVDPHTAMPDMAVTSSDARNITAYLYAQD